MTPELRSRTRLPVDNLRRFSDGNVEVEMSFRDRLRDRVVRWIDSDWSANIRRGVGPGLGGSLQTPPAVEEMAADVVAESDRPEQEGERKGSRSE